jgi:hypothetical protein
MLAEDPRAALPSLAKAILLPGAARVARSHQRLSPKELSAGRRLKSNGPDGA